MTAPISHSKSAEYSSEIHDKMKTGVSECLVMKFIYTLVEERSWHGSPWLITGSLGPVSYVPLVSWIAVPGSPFLGASQVPDSDVSSSVALCSRRDQLWGQTAAETSLGPSPLRSLCILSNYFPAQHPAAHLWLRPTPGAGLQATEGLLQPG